MPFKDERPQWPTIGEARSPEQKSGESRRRRDGLINPDAPRQGRSPSGRSEAERVARRLQSDFNGLGIHDADPMHQDKGVPIQEARWERAQTDAGEHSAGQRAQATKAGRGVGSSSSTKREAPTTGTISPEQTNTSEHRTQDDKGNAVRAENERATGRKDAKRPCAGKQVFGPQAFSTCYTRLWCRRRTHHANEAALVSHWAQYHGQQDGQEDNLEAAHVEQFRIVNMHMCEECGKPRGGTRGSAPVNSVTTEGLSRDRRSLATHSHRQTATPSQQHQIREAQQNPSKKPQEAGTDATQSAGNEDWGKGPRPDRRMGKHKREERGAWRPNGLPTTRG